jgi:sugar phosphate isomerase/epimerase
MRISYQLYSARNHGSLDSTLAELHAIGFRRVEGYQGLFEDVDALERSLDTHKLTMPSSHMALDLLEADPDKAIAIARQLGIDSVFAPHLEEQHRPSDAAGWRALAARLSAVAKRLADAHIAFGWHNHDFELVKTTDGVVPLTEMLAHAPDILWQADLAWVQRAGADASALLDAHADQLASVHVKDIAPAGECVDEDGWADPGEGVMDWNALLTRSKQCERDVFYVAEHDKPSDAARFARRAFAYLNASGTAAGDPT